jgi:hypothetical protein
MSEEILMVVNTTIVPDIPFEIMVNTLSDGTKVINDSLFNKFYKWVTLPETSKENIKIVIDKINKYVKEK